MAGQINRRRNYFIKKEFQALFILKFCALIIIGSFLSGAIIYLMAKSTVTTSFENSRLVVKTTADYILPSVLLSSSVVIFLIGLATIIVTLFTSHKIAGPLYRIESNIKEMIQGNLGVSFKLRAGDEITALAESLDTMTKTVASRIREVKQMLDSLEDLAKTAPHMNEKIKNLKNAIAKFKT